MFHRNKLDDADYRTVNTPYLKIGSFYLHKFGLDITFEKEGEYRASILIKTFNVVDRNERSNKTNLIEIRGWQARIFMTTSSLWSQTMIH